MGIYDGGSGDVAEGVASDAEPDTFVAVLAGGDGPSVRVTQMEAGRRALLLS